MTGQISDQGFLSQLRTAAWLTQSRIIAYGSILAAAHLFGLAIAICRAHGWLVAPEPHLSTEFMSFYAAGRLIIAGHAASVYLPPVLAGYIHANAVPAGFVAMQQQISGDSDISIMGFFYPPVFWLLCAPVAHLGFYQAEAVWITAGLFLFVCLLRQLLGSWRFVWLAAGFMPVLKNAAIGENAYLSASLIGFGLLNVWSRPVLAGILFGGLCYKPHFLLPIGIFLVAGRHWRALTAMAASCTALCGLSGLIFGWQNWVDYFQIVVPHAEWVFAHHGFSYAIQVTPFSALRLLGGSVTLGHIAQSIATVFAGAAIIAARRAGPDIQAAIVTASFPLIASVMLDYDLCITGLAIIFLYRAARVTKYLPYEKTAMALLYLMPFIVLSLRTELHIPLDPLIPVFFIATLLARLRAERIA